MIKENPVADNASSAGLIVVLNWLEELREKFQGSKVP